VSLGPVFGSLTDQSRTARRTRGLRRIGQRDPARRQWGRGLRRRQCREGAEIRSKPIVRTATRCGARVARRTRASALRSPILRVGNPECRTEPERRATTKPQEQYTPIRQRLSAATHLARLPAGHTAGECLPLAPPIASHLHRGLQSRRKRFFRALRAPSSGTASRGRRPAGTFGCGCLPRPRHRRYRSCPPPRQTGSGTARRRCQYCPTW
jgi:hypothetical protein